jgi:hypothetical protein
MSEHTNHVPGTDYLRCLESGHFRSCSDFGTLDTCDLRLGAGHHSRDLVRRQEVRSLFAFYRGFGHTPSLCV